MARCNRLLTYGGKSNKPVYDEKIYPLEHSYKGVSIAAFTSDQVKTGTEKSIEMRAVIREAMILPDINPTI